MKADIARRWVNDSGVSFSAIAQIIEQHWEEL